MVLMEKVKDLLIMLHYMDSTVLLATWVEANDAPDLTPEEFPTSPLFFVPYVDKFYAQMGRAQNWLKMRFRCNQPPTFFTSEYCGISKPWFNMHTSAGYSQVCQTHHDTGPVGWFLMAGPFIDHVFLESSIKETLVGYLPAGETIQFGIMPPYQKVCTPLASDDIKSHPGVAKRDHGGYPTYRPLLLECESEKIPIMQSILRKLFNVHKDPWLRLKHYDVLLLPPPGQATEGSRGAEIWPKQPKAHVKVVFSLHETKTNIFAALDEPFECEDGTVHTARGVLLSVTHPIHEDFELQDERRPTATIDPATGKTPKQLYHSVDVIRPNRGECLVTSYNDRY